MRRFNFKKIVHALLNFRKLKLKVALGDAKVLIDNKPVNCLIY